MTQTNTSDREIVISRPSTIMLKVITVMGFIFLLTGIAGSDKFLAAPKSENNVTINTHMESQTKTIKKEIVLPQSRDKVWIALTDSKILGEWIYPNDFQPKVGHKFTFQVPGITVSCEVLECEPTTKLSYSWEGGPVKNTKVTYRLVSEGDSTRLIFEHSGFDTTIPDANTYIGGAEYGWNMMLGKLKEG